MCLSPGMFQENKTFLLMSIVSNGIEYLRQVGFCPVYGNFNLSECKRWTNVEQLDKMWKHISFYFSKQINIWKATARNILLDDVYNEKEWYRLKNVSLSQVIRTGNWVCFYDANFVITGGIAGCRYDNLQCHQWW